MNALESSSITAEIFIIRRSAGNTLVMTACKLYNTEVFGSAVTPVERGDANTNTAVSSPYLRSDIIFAVALLIL